MWINKIFAREFGFSDVQSNYSRVYAWMANQLGHMTLGMATVFFFVWIAETISATTRLIVDWEGRPRRVPEDCDFAAFCVANNHLLFFASAIVIGCVLFVPLRGLFAKPPKEVPGENKGYIPISWRRRKVLHALFLLLMAAAAWWLSVLVDGAFAGASNGAAQGSEAAAAESKRLIELVGVSAACFAVGAGVLLLCRDFRYFLFAVMSLFGAFWIASSGAGFGRVTHQGVAVALAAIFGVYALWSTVGFGNLWPGTQDGAIGGAMAKVRAFLCKFSNVPENLGALERGIQASIIVILSLWFVSGTWNGLEGQWPMAIGAAIASCSLWWVKEFGSDLPNVQREIAIAAARRPKRLLGLCPACESGYINDARMDARTDALFYFAGAWIGAGVISQTPTLTKTSWESGAELVGLIVFLIIFLAVGKNWAFRQQALDFCAVDMASRLAVFHSALRLVTIPPERELMMGRAAETGAAAAPPLPYLDEPLDVLGEFARGRWRDTPEPARFDHLIVFGAVGSGRSPLGRALASEAALADLPTLAERLSFGGEAKPRRTARFVRAARLPSILRDVIRREDVVATPTVDLLVPIDDGEVVRWDGNEYDKATHEVEARASLVVIDDMSLERGATPARQLASLAVEKGQQTVWLIDDARFDDMNDVLNPETVEAWEPDYRDVENELAAMLAALTVDGAAPRIAVGFTRRYSASETADALAPPAKP